MKYQISSMKKVAVKAPFDFAAATESLNSALDDLVVAQEAFYSAESRVDEVVQVLADLDTVKKSIESFGVCIENMSLFNAENALDEALGLEKLDVASLETLSESTKTLLKSNYLTAVEGQVAELVKTGVERIKEFFAKLINWLKEHFTVTARLMKTIKELSFDGAFDAEKKVNAFKYEDATNMISFMKGVEARLTDIQKSAAQVVGESKSATPPECEKTEGTAKDLGWDVGNAKTVQTELLALIGKPGVANAWKAIQEQYKAEIAQSKTDANWLEKSKDKLANWRLGAKLTSQYNGCMRKIGFTLITLSKLSKKEEKGAEPAK